MAKLHSKEEFRAAMESAREDIAQARKAGLEPTVDCEAEAKALAIRLH